MRNNAIKWLISVPGKKKLYILALTVLQMIYGASGVLYALLLRNIVDSATVHNKNDFYVNSVLMVILLAGQILLNAVIKRLTEYSRSSLENIFKSRLLQNILYRDFSGVSAVHSGEWMNRLTNDAVVVADNYVDILPGLAGMIVKMISAVIMMLALDKHFALMIFPGGLIIFILSYGFRKNLKKLHKTVQEKDGKLRIFLQERIASLIMIRSYASERQTVNEAAAKLEAHKNARMKKADFSNLCNAGFGAAMDGMYIFGILYCGHGILAGTISYGMLTAVLQLISQIQAPFANITGYLPKFYAMTASAERLMEIEKFENECDIDAYSIKKISDYYENELVAFGLKNADFTYYPAVDKISELSKNNMPVVLKNISISIKKREYVAFTGHSGCGKSTVLKLLMSIYPLDSGERFLIDNCGEKSLNSEYRRLFAYVPQGNQLMSGPIREIISFSDRNDENNDDRIMNALKIACADKFVSELENGVDTILGERGSGLSEGQMQRIAIARAIFSESPVLLLDESTSALDAMTEKELLENLRKMTDKTVVIVTHRPAAFDICDRILEFTENGVVERNGAE